MSDSNYLQDLTAHLEGEGITTPVRRGARPDRPHSVAVLTDYGGPAPEFAHGAAAPYSIMSRIQVLCRGTAHDYDAPRLLAQQVFDIFAALRNMQLGGKLYRHVEPLQPPFYLEQDDELRILIACNYEIDVQH